MNEQEDSDFLGPLKGDLTIIRLTIKNASKLYSTGLIDKYCVLKDNLGEASDAESGEDALENFESGIFEDSFVLWISKLKKKRDENAGYSISLDAIDITEPKETKFFEGNLQVGGGKGILAWTKESFEGLTPEKYALYFTLTNPNGDSKQFVIDPKLKGRTSGFAYSYLVQRIQILVPIQKLRDKILGIIQEHQKSDEDN